MKFMKIKNIKKISVVLFIALLQNLFLFASCTDKINKTNENADNNSRASTEQSPVSAAEQITPPITQSAVSKFTYEGDFSEAFSNPERGYYKRSEITERNDFTYVKDLNITIVHSYIPIYTYFSMSGDNPWGGSVTEKLPEKLLENLQNGLNAIREAGLKVILRPAYAWDWTPPVAGHRDIVKSHIAQINGVIYKNADVVMGLEAGILGPWGEWHSDGIYTDSNSKKGAEFRYELFKYILDTTPDSIPVMLRYPYFIKEMRYLAVNPPEGQTAVTQAQLSRLGYHDDSFMADENDWGSYNPREVWWGKLSGLAGNRVTNDIFRKWMTEEMYNDPGTHYTGGGNLMTGGETEWDDKATPGHENSIPPLRVLTEMADMHTTYMNTDYNPKHIDLWKETNIPASDIGEPAESAYGRIERRLGYRLRLTEAEMTTAETAGGEFIITAAIVNDGFAGIVKPRPLYAVLDGGNNRYDILLASTDVRDWTPGNIVFGSSFKLPEDMPKGVYTIALWLPDNAENLRLRPEYSVRFANKNIWDNKNGYNKLGELTVF